MKVTESLKSGGRFYFDVFNVENPKEWGPEATEIYDDLNLGREGYERGDLFLQADTMGRPWLSFTIAPAKAL